MFVFEKKLKILLGGPLLHNHCMERHQNLGGTSSNSDKYICIKFKFNPSTSWGIYARHRHHLLHGARSTTDTRVWHKHTTGELKTQKSFSNVCFTLQNMGSGKR